MHASPPAPLDFALCDLEKTGLYTFQYLYCTKGQSKAIYCVGNKYVCGMYTGNINVERLSVILESFGAAILKCTLTRKQLIIERQGLKFGPPDVCI